MLISDDYRRLNAELHRTNDAYGVSGQRWAPVVRDLARTLGAPDKIVTVLDYGCGKGTLKAALKIPEFYLYEYDPAIEGKNRPPEPADLVVCTDVLEHIEPDCLDGVLDDLRALTRRMAFLTIATRPAKKTLGDGRNAHLIVQPVNWWAPQLMARWTLKRFEDRGGEFLMIGAVE